MQFKVLEIFKIVYILFISTKLSYSYIVIPFKYTNTYEPQNNDKENSENLSASEYFMKYNYSNTIYSEISLGTPEQKTNFIISMSKSSFYLGSDLCINPKFSSYYNYDKSSTFHNLTTCSDKFESFSNACEMHEKIYLYNNTNLDSSVPIVDMILLYVQNNSKLTNDENACGVLGLSLINKDVNSVDQRFFSYLKHKGVISKWTWTFQFFNDNNKNNYDGYFIAGALPHEYDKKNFNYYDYKNIKVETREIMYAWDIKFHKIYFYNNQKLLINFKDNIFIDSGNINNYLQGELNLDYNYIVTNQEFFKLLKNQFFNDYLTNNICVSENVSYLNNAQNPYEVISCDKKKFDPKKFPTIYLYHLELNYTFSFDYKELFSEINGKIVFLMTTSNFNDVYWIFGKLFMKKYQLTFDIDNRIIISYLKEKENGEKNNLYIYLIIGSIILIIIALIGGIYIGKKLWDKSKKKRANELVDDDFEYKAETNNNSNNKLGI